MMAKKSTENAGQQRDEGGRIMDASVSEHTEVEQRRPVPPQLTPWKPGQSGNPAGRPQGSRNKFAQQYIEDYYQVWQRKGIKALEDCADTQPAKFILVAAHLIPQHFKVEHEHKLSMLSDAELRQNLLEAQEELKRAGITIDIEAEEVAALPAPAGDGSKA
jgi:uncharacterized protein DUF5681